MITIFLFFNVTFTWTSCDVPSVQLLGLLLILLPLAHGDVAQLLGILRQGRSRCRGHAGEVGGVSVARVNVGTAFVDGVDVITGSCPVGHGVRPEIAG